MRNAGSAALLVLLAGTATAIADGSGMVFDVTPLPGLAGSPGWVLMPEFINQNGEVAGQASPGHYHAARWTAAGGIENLNPGAGVIASWTKGMNDLGVVVGDACIPPPGGNGACGMYLFRNTPGVGSEQIDLSESGIVGAGAVWPMLLNNNGVIAMGFWISGSNARHTMLHSDELGWLNVNDVLPREEFTEVSLLDLNNSDQVLVRGGWNRPTYRWSPGGTPAMIIDLPLHAASDMNDAGQVAGGAEFASGYGAFRYTDGAGVEMLDPAGAFPESHGHFINEAGMVAGTWDGGLFIFTDDGGMQDLGVDGFIAIKGFNARGDLTIQKHDPQTYQGKPIVRLAGEPAFEVQELIDPTREKIVISHISEINDRRQFAVHGVQAVSPFAQVAFLVQARCAADYDADGVATVPDIFAFLSDWFAGVDKANVNRDGSLNVGDIFAFLSDWFAGC